MVWLPCMSFWLLRLLCCWCSCLLFLFFVCNFACCTRCRGLTFTSARVLVRARNRWAKLSTHRHRSPHLLCDLCSHAHFGRATTARSSPRRLGCPHWLAHAVEHDHFFGASTSGRTIFLCLETFTAETWIGEIGDNSPFAMADLGVCLFTAMNVQNRFRLRALMIKRSEVLRLLGSATGHSG